MFIIQIMPNAINTVYDIIIYFFYPFRQRTLNLPDFVYVYILSMFTPENLSFFFLFIVILFVI